MNPPAQVPRIAGAARDRGQHDEPHGESATPLSAAGAAIPSPSVTLWIMKPTIRNEPSASWPNANEDPIASPSPKLCSRAP